MIHCQPWLPDHFFLTLEKETMSGNREPTTSISLKYPLITSHQYKGGSSRKATGGGTTSANQKIKPRWPTLWLNTAMFLASQITRASQLPLHSYDEGQWNSCSNCFLPCKLFWVRGMEVAAHCQQDKRNLRCSFLYCLSKPGLVALEDTNSVVLGFMESQHILWWRT